ncbi:MAG: nucleotide exchange factor GrpE [Acholeplasmatales bacterium]|nr:nucleotide exchange factor GrpE [Acholeplasmatales bacterium]
MEEKDNITEEVNEEVKEEIVNDEAKEESKVEKKEKKNKLKEKIDALEIQNAELKDKLLRNAAELENFKRRTNEERIKERKYASCDLVTDLVSILTNLDKCVNMETEDPMLKNFLIGFKMINNQLFDRLVQDGLEEIKANKGDAFDPNLHHAIETTEIEGVESNTITEVVQKGYKYKERVIKPAMVKVNK